MIFTSVCRITRRKRKDMEKSGEVWGTPQIEGFAVEFVINLEDFVSMFFKIQRFFK